MGGSRWTEGGYNPSFRGLAPTAPDDILIKCNWTSGMKIK